MNKNQLNDINQALREYGLTRNEVKIYLFLSKIGVKIASEISKSVNVPRTVVYPLLESLEKKGIVFSINAKPIKFSAVGISKCLEILINNEKHRINKLNANKKNVIRLWDNLTLNLE